MNNNSEGRIHGSFKTRPITSLYNVWRNVTSLSESQGRLVIITRCRAWPVSARSTRIPPNEISDLLHKDSFVCHSLVPLLSNLVLSVLLDPHFLIHRHSHWDSRLHFMFLSRDWKLIFLMNFNVGLHVKRGKTIRTLIEDHTGRTSPSIQHNYTLTIIKN